MDLGLTGRRAVVLSSTRGLGRGVADALAAEGCLVAVCSRDAQAVERAIEELRASGGRVVGWPCDVADGGSLDLFFDRVMAELGGADVLVTNSGGPPPGEVDSLEDADWQAAFELLVLSVVRSCRRVLPGMRERGWGRIVNVTSVGVKEPLPNLVLSNALRAAVVGYSKSLAREVARDGVLVHSVMPGSFLTDRNRELGAAIARERGVELDELIDSWARDVPVGRMGDPLEFGRMVAFLASDLCSFSTGTAIPVEGGALRGVL